MRRKALHGRRKGIRGAALLLAAFLLASSGLTPLGARAAQENGAVAESAAEPAAGALSETQPEDSDNAPENTPDSAAGNPSVPQSGDKDSTSENAASGTATGDGTTGTASGEAAGGNTATGMTSEEAAGENATTGATVEESAGENASDGTASGEAAGENATTGATAEESAGENASTGVTAEESAGEGATTGVTVEEAADENATTGKTAEETQESGQELNVEIIPALTDGLPGITYDLLEGVRTEPAQDAAGRDILVRVQSVTATQEDFVWDGVTTLTPEAGGVTYTIVYEAYVETDGEAEQKEASENVAENEADAAEAEMADAAEKEAGESEKVLATLSFDFAIREGRRMMRAAEGQIGERLDGDYAYIAAAFLKEDKTTASGLAVRTGTAPFDDAEADGDDTTDRDNIVRSFDVISYTVGVKNEVRADAPFTAYKTGKLYYEFLMPGNTKQLRYETESMGWLKSKPENEYTVTEREIDGQTYQVLRGSFLWEPSPENPAAIGESYLDLSVVARVLERRNGDVLQPKFTFWLEHNDVEQNGPVTGSSHDCAEHGEQEHKTVTAPEVRVTTAPRYNVRVEPVDEQFQAMGTFDFSTGNDLAQNKDAGQVAGRLGGYAVTLEVRGKSEQHGLRGCEIPDGSDITFDLRLSSMYRNDGGVETETTTGYLPLLWSMEGNEDGAPQQDGRALTGEPERNPYMIKKAPFNTRNPQNSGNKNNSCKNGGTWRGVQEDSTIHITISGYEVDMAELPRSTAGTDDWRFFNPKTTTGYWEAKQACFSAGEFWVVQPFHNQNSGVHVTDELGSGTFTTTMADGRLAMTGISGRPLPESAGSENQTKPDDDVAKWVVYLTEQPGQIDQKILWSQYGQQVSRTPGCGENGKDWIMSEGKLGVWDRVAHTGAEGMNRGVAYDLLTKFDDVFFDVEMAEATSGPAEVVKTNKVLYGAKPAKNTGWDHKGLQPDEAGYDDEMRQATADDLIFFSSLEELKRQGYVCVATLYEWRGLADTGIKLGLHNVTSGTVKPDAPLNQVYMTTHTGKMWRMSDVQQQAAAYANKAVDDLTDEDYRNYAMKAFPSRADKGAYSTNAAEYPTPGWVNEERTGNGLANYKKVWYDEDGYVGGTGGTLFGDSCLHVPYASKVKKDTIQSLGDTQHSKDLYDMDAGQRVADYVLKPFAERGGGETSMTGTQVTSDFYIEDTLPKGLTYIPGSSYFGGEYKQTAEGEQGRIEGGTPLEPEVIPQADGKTLLRWTLKSLVVTKEYQTYFEPLYYSCRIGTPDNIATDVKNHDKLTNTVNIWSKAEQKREFKVAWSNKAEKGILVSKNSAFSLSKTADKREVKLGEPIGFALNIGNNAANPVELVAVDAIPYDGDALGSHFHGTCYVTELTVPSPELLPQFALYYTMDEALRGKSSIDFEKTDFADGAVWKKLTADADGKVQLPENFAPVAVAAVGDLGAMKTLKMHITLYLPDGKPGDGLTNRLTYSQLGSKSTTEIVGEEPKPDPDPDPDPDPEPEPTPDPTPDPEPEPKPEPEPEPEPTPDPTPTPTPEPTPDPGPTPAPDHGQPAQPTPTPPAPVSPAVPAVQPPVPLQPTVTPPVPTPEPEKPEQGLPQTGQLWWPVALLLAAGAGLTVYGIYEKQKRKKRDKK